MKYPDSAEQKGDAGGKKVSGIKRHIGVDTQGLPHAIQVTTAAGACAMIDLVLGGAIEAKGFVRQEQVPLAMFLETRFGKHYA